MLTEVATLPFNRRRSHAAASKDASRYVKAYHRHGRLVKVLAHVRNYFITVQITQTVLVSSKKTRHPAESKKQQIHRGESGFTVELVRLDVTGRVTMDH
eukprot:m.475167 g.475167  ORF g.475167 m.475167 type:complete len:99 (+) comp37817_c0_seq1:89-385(+)